MSLPDSCELTPSHLVFWELTTEAQAGEVDALYEYCCTVACTNALRPLGPVEVRMRPIPVPPDDQLVQWGPRALDAEAARTYSAQGYVLCELRLPVQAMGAPVPPGVPVARPPLS